MINHIPLISTVISGGFLLGMIQDKVNVLCEENKTIKKDYNLLREKICDIHIKVCNIDNKINNILEK